MSLKFHQKLGNIMDAQILQTAINGATNAHTDLHKAIHQLRYGSVIEAKQMLARQIAVLSSVLMILSIKIYSSFSV